MRERPLSCPPESRKSASSLRWWWPSTSFCGYVSCAALGCTCTCGTTTDTSSFTRAVGPGLLLRPKSVKWCLTYIPTEKMTANQDEICRSPRNAHLLVRAAFRVVSLCWTYIQMWISISTMNTSAPRMRPVIGPEGLSHNDAVS